MVHQTAVLPDFFPREIAVVPSRHVLPIALIDLTVLSSPSRTRGIGRYAADLARALDDAAPRSGMTVRAIERFGWTGRATIADDLRGAVARQHQARFSHARWAYRVRLRLAAVVRDTRPDLVHSPHPDATPIGPLGCPRIVTCHDLISLKQPDHYSSWRDGWHWGRPRLDARRYGSADHIIAVSDTTARDLVEILGIDAGKITVVRHGVDLGRFRAVASPADAEVRERYGLADRPYLLFVGAADWRKNAEGMLAALHLLRRGPNGRDVVLAWAGRLDPPDLSRVQQEASDRRLGEALRLLGWVPDADLAALMRGAVALLFVSRIEGFGYPIVEAMACGCPVIGSDRPATIEIGGEAILTVDPERPEAIAAAVSTLLADARERRRLAECGAVRTRAFSLDRMADETVQVYRRMAGRP